MIKLKRGAAINTSGCLGVRVGGNKFNSGTLVLTRETFFWKGKRTVVHWGINPVEGKFEL